MPKAAPRTAPATAKGKAPTTPEGPAPAGQSAGVKSVFPGPARNPATNLLLTDIALRGGLRLGRRLIERSLLRRHFTADQARDIIKGRPLSKSILSLVVTRIATRSLPGAALVGGGLLAKLIYDRRKSARAAEAEGRAELAQDAENA